MAIIIKSVAQTTAETAFYLTSISGEEINFIVLSSMPTLALVLQRM
jgi:hypothetical protein